MKKRTQKPVVRIQNEKTKEKDRSRKHEKKPEVKKEEYRIQ
jgi:hypothetical protein